MTDALAKKMAVNPLNEVMRAMDSFQMLYYVAPERVIMSTGYQYEFQKWLLMSDRLKYTLMDPQYRQRAGVLNSILGVGVWTHNEENKNKVYVQGRHYAPLSIITNVIEGHWYLSDPRSWKDPRDD